MHSKEAKSFVKAMAVVGKKHLERELAHKNLSERLNEIKKASSKKKNVSKHIGELGEHIEHVIKAEKQFAAYGLGSDEKTKALEQKVSELEGQIQILQENHASEIASYKHMINDMKQTFASLKTKLIELINDKRERDRRMQMLHEKIQQGIPSPIQPYPSHFFNPRSSR